MNAQTLKQEALESLQRLPEDTDIDEMMYRLYVIDKLHKSREAVQLGQVISQDDLEREIAKW
jgi:Mg/Co/Ni transporter MgtE